MNTSRLVVLGLAAVAAGGAAFLARGMLGGGSQQSAASPMPAPVETARVLVAAGDLVPGRPLTPDEMRWQDWPSKSVDPSFLTDKSGATPETVAKGTVVRSPIVNGEPITENKIVHADAVGIMSASLTPGMRAVSINVSVASVAGGFIKPGDRVDLVLTAPTEGTKKFRATTILHNVRVLAIDQTFAGAKKKDDEAVSDVKTATLELTPGQAERVTRAQASGILSLSLRSLVEQVADGRSRVAAARAKYNNGKNNSDDDNITGEVSVIRYGVMHNTLTSEGE